MATSKARGRSANLARLGVGATIALLSFFGLDWVSGGVLGAPSKIAKVLVLVLLDCTGLPPGVRPSFKASISLRNPKAIEFQVIAFDTILDYVRRHWTSLESLLLPVE